MASKAAVMRLRRAVGFAGVGVLLASCGSPFSAPVSRVGSAPASRAARIAPFSCYETKQTPQTVTSTITFYGWPDNSPPGNQIAHPVIHQVASGDGTWCNPTTFATEHSNDKLLPYGIKIYVPFLKQYFIREDDCAPLGPKQGCYKLWMDLWIGGDAKSNFKAVLRCERRLTPNAKVHVVLWPKAGLPVKLPGAIYRDDPPPNGTCFGMPGT